MQNENENMIENEIENTREQQMQSRKFLALYIIGLFSVALVLIILSYLTQIRASDELEKINSQLGVQISATTGAEQRVSQLQTMVGEQEAKIKELEEQIEKIDELEQQVEMQDDFIMLQKVYYSDEKTDLSEMIINFEEKYTGKMGTEIKLELENFKSTQTDVENNENVE